MFASFNKFSFKNYNVRSRVYFMYINKLQYGFVLLLYIAVVVRCCITI